MKTGQLIRVFGIGVLVASLFQVVSQAQVHQGVATPAMQYFGNRHSNATIQGPATSVVTRSYGAARQPLQVAGGKPFEHENIQGQPTLSPYLAGSMPCRNATRACRIGTCSCNHNYDSEELDRHGSRVDADTAADASCSRSAHCFQEPPPALGCRLLARTAIHECGKLLSRHALSESSCQRFNSAMFPVRGSLKLPGTSSFLPAFRLARGGPYVFAFCCRNYWLVLCYSNPSCGEIGSGAGKALHGTGEVADRCGAVGQFTVTGTEMSDPKPERYELTGVKHVGDGNWMFVARIKYGNHDVTLPITLPVKWAGDTPVITVDKMSFPGLGTYTARVMIYEDHYAGFWSGADHGGHLFGVVERNAVKEQPAATGEK